MKDRAWFEAKLADVRKTREQQVANVHACDGVIAFCSQAITDLLNEDQALVKPEADGNQRPHAD